ncbi:hypothetical protein Avbf_18408 [Armadillidium vulgare]|nr:hypothetical protein Avbf_18408 [Armadillidium vulgare]
MISLTVSLLSYKLNDYKINMWNELQGTFVLFLVFQSSRSSDDSCTTLDLPIGSNRTSIFESFSWEAKYWIKPKSDFKRRRAFIQQIVTHTPYWLKPQQNKTAQKKIGMKTLSLMAIQLELMEEIMRTNTHSPFMTETPAKQNSTKENRNENPLSNSNSTRTDGRENEDKYTSPFMTETTTVPSITNKSLLSNKSSTKTDNEDKYQRVTLADILKEDRKFSLVNRQNKSQSENEGQDKTYETPSRVRYISHEKSIPPPVPSPIYLLCIIV